MKNTTSTVPKNNSISEEEALARLCLEAALDKKADNPVILDLRGISSLTDFFLIVSAASEPQIKAIASSIRQKTREEKDLTPFADDAYPGSSWIVLDYGSLIIHIFHEKLRSIYDLESLWGDAKKVTMEERIKT